MEARDLGDQASITQPITLREDSSLEPKYHLGHSTSFLYLLLSIYWVVSMHIFGKMLLSFYLLTSVF